MILGSFLFFHCYFTSSTSRTLSSKIKVFVTIAFIVTSCPNIPSVGELIGDFSYKPSLSEDDKKLLTLTAKQKKILLKHIDFLSEIEDFF